MSAIADLLDELEFFQDFRFQDLEILARFMNLQEVRRGEVIFCEGEPGNAMLILVDGKVSIAKGSVEAGNRGLLSYEGRGRIIGEMALLDRELRSATCIADTDCRMLLLQETALVRFAAEHAALAYRFMFSLARLLSRRLRRTSGVLAEYLVS